MHTALQVVTIYLLGGLTFIPIVLCILYFSLKPYTAVPGGENDTSIPRTSQPQLDKSGWIRLTKTYKLKGDSNVAVLMSYVQGTKRQRECVYAELKGGALFIYASDQPEETCYIIIPIHNYTVSIYPPPQQDQEVFSKPSALRLTPRTDLKETDLVIMGDDSLAAEHNELYINCTRPIDKEDWYFGLLAATQMMNASDVIETVDMTHFDPDAMQKLISTVQQDAEYREVQWLNAIMGRLFLGLYKTDTMRRCVQSKINKKAEKVKLPSCLGGIRVQSVEMGASVPYVTQPKLLSLTPQGDLMAEATVHYAGGFCVVIQTDFTLTYSSLMKPIRVPLVLSVALKKLSGRFVIKVKPPPSNRCWIGFCEMPVMEWEITPVVSDKQIRLSVVTNAIQAKIKEFVSENLVLPNMDDFPFCPSDGLGGIFGGSVPKPSSMDGDNEMTASQAGSPMAIPSTAICLDMLGNKLSNKTTAVVPKVVVADMGTKNILLSAGDQKRPVVPARRATMCNLDIPSSLGKDGPESSSTSPSSLSSAAATFRPRGYSNPNISCANNHSSTSAPCEIEEVSQHNDSDDITIAIMASPLMSAITTSRKMMMKGVGIRKRQLVSPECTTTPPIQEAITVENKQQEDTTIGVSKPNNGSLLSKLNNATTKLNNNKKLYSMAGNLFSKKRVTKEVREERSRELLESHNRKMTHLFLNNTVAPPALPPRPNTASSETSLLCPSSSDENLTEWDEEEEEEANNNTYYEGTLMTAKEQANNSVLIVHPSDYASL